MDYQQLCDYCRSSQTDSYLDNKLLLNWLYTVGGDSFVFCSSSPQEINKAKLLFCLINKLPQPQPQPQKTTKKAVEQIVQEQEQDISSGKTTVRVQSSVVAYSQPVPINHVFFTYDDE